MFSVRIIAVSKKRRQISNVSELPLCCQIAYRLRNSSEEKLQTVYTFVNYQDNLSLDLTTEQTNTFSRF